MSRDGYKKRYESASERIEDLLASIRSRARKGKDGEPMLFTSNRELKRGGAGQPRSRVFSETMKIPKGRSK
jgi:hypothetical protein